MGRLFKEELPVVEMTPPQKLEYETDVLVVGTGFAGIPAAVEAVKNGARALLVDKGYIAHSGCSPWAQCYQFFNKDFGDDADMQIEYTRKAGEYIANLDWYRIYLEESYDAFQEIKEWGIYDPFPKASECEPDYYESGDSFGYHERFREHDRRQAWIRLTERYGIPCVNHTMITNVIVEDGRVCGAMGLDVPSGAVVTFHAGAVILATGGGSYKPAGYPLSGNSFDGEYICYELGLPIVGREFEWPHATNSIHPAACWNTYSWGWLENLHATAGMSQFAESIDKQAMKSLRDIGLLGKLPHLKDGIKPLGPDEVGFVPLGNAARSTAPERDERVTGNNVDRMPKRDVLGASVGQGNWKDSGVFCGLDDFEGYTGIPGLYVAGDAYGCMMFGAVYTPGQGGSLPVSHIQGKHSGRAAAGYVLGAAGGDEKMADLAGSGVGQTDRVADGNVSDEREAAVSGSVMKAAESAGMDQAARVAGRRPAARIPAGRIAAETEKVLAPLRRETGLDPRWARDVLQSIMAPYWISMAKDEESLQAALTAVLRLKNEVQPILIARDAHDLRLVHEVVHKICDAEIRLRTALERRESRGTHYRTDFPNRNDSEFLCYITARKGEGGEMLLEKVPVKPEWAGDVTMDYEKRYIVRFPGEVV